MLLENKVAVIYGAYGAVGAAVARAFSEQGARVFLTGRDRARLTALGTEMPAPASRLAMDVVDACNEDSVEAHMDAVLQRAGRVDISFNAIGIPQTGIQGIPLTELSLEAFTTPLLTYSRSHFITARAAARRMSPQGSGVILMHTPEPGRSGAPLVGGMGPAWAALEGLTRDLSAELSVHGIRVICLRTTGLPETATIDEVFGLHAKAIGISRQQFQALMEGMAHHRRSTKLSELTGAAAFAASDLAAGVFGSTLNLTAGKSSD
jgi:NAD(P)-dependent dehydrogenase (short-subunit alcohol dehydrogenase family)